jgi:two-component system, sensor histidine kinase FlrB
VLQIARSGRIELALVDLRDPIEAAVHAVEPVAARAGATLRTALPDVPTTVQGDGTALQQLFTNLLANAAQAVAEGGTIEVNAALGRESVTVRVRDDGRGIASEALVRVREPFFTTRADGTGLGLAIAERIATAHQAELTIESEVGRGTVASVRFPRAGNEPLHGDVGSVTGNGGRLDADVGGK